MDEWIDKRTEELEKELAAGERLLGELEKKTARLKESMLRIAGALQVLEEARQAGSDSAGADGSGADDAGAGEDPEAADPGDTSLSAEEATRRATLPVAWEENETAAAAGGAQ